MPIVIQFPRDFIYNKGAFNYLLATPELRISDPVWISIREKNAAQDPSHLDGLPNLKIDFDDVNYPMEYNGQVLAPPTPEDANKIITFLKQFWGKDVFVNCAAGISRSGAVAEFLSEQGYFWPKVFRERAKSNPLLLQLLRSAF
jgi:protein-tyrosine phosphatase